MFKKIIPFIFILMFSCAAKDSYIKKFGEFINEVELSNESYSEEEWKHIEVEFNDYSEIIFMDYEIELTEAELKQVESFRRRYKKVKIKNNPAGEIGNEILEFLGI
jgi:hypothetical protein